MRSAILLHLRLNCHSNRCLREPCFARPTTLTNGQEFSIAVPALSFSAEGDTGHDRLLL
jgi:hypothetical protein